MMILPYIAKSNGLTDSEFGILQTFFGVLQMIGGPIFGFLTRRFGIRNAILLCYASTALSATVKFAATERTGLYVSTLPSVLMHGQQAHQTLLSALTRPGQERTNAFGRMGITFGIGFILTPIISSLTSVLFGKASILITSAMISVIAIYVLLWHLNQEAYEIKTENKGNFRSEKERRDTNVRLIVEIVVRPGVFSVLIKKVGLITPMILFTSVIQIHLINAFQVTPEINSFIQVFVGLLVMIINGFVIIKLRERFNEEILLLFGAAASFVGNILLTQLFALWMLFVALPFMCLGMSLIGTVCDSMLTAAVNVDEQGLVLGTANMANSVTRTFAPAIAGYMLEHFGFPIFGCLGATTSALTLLPKLPTFAVFAL